jgi:hypothetical protein
MSICNKAVDLGQLATRVATIYTCTECSIPNVIGYFP